MKHIFNAHALVSVKIVDKQENYEWSYKQYRKGSWLRFPIKEGYYYLYHIDIYTGGVHTEQEVINKNNGLLIEDKVVYYRPYATLTFTNGETYTKNFNTYEEALTWGREQANTGIQVRLEF